MAHPNKFVSVNLNKSYGQPTIASSNPRARPASHSSSTVSGGMVVLSRPRSSSSSASAPKLSVPPPLNLPSLRKENEKFDLSSALGSSARPGSSGIGSGPGPVSVGWMKPAPSHSGRSGSGGGPGPVAFSGDEFPSLKATVASSSEALRQKDKANLMNQSEKKMTMDDEQLQMRPQMRSSAALLNTPVSGDGGEQQQQKFKEQERSFPGPLPHVKLIHTSDWADDERDTGLSFPERDGDRGFLRAEYESTPSKEMYKGDSFGRGDVVSTWRTPSKPFGVGREVNRDNCSFGHSLYGNNARDIASSRRDLSSVMNTHNGRNAGEGYNGRGGEQQNARAGSRYGDLSGSRYGDLSGNRYKGDTFQHNAASKTPFSYATKGLELNDPILNFGRERRMNSSSNGKMYLGDVGFDGTDPFSDDPVGEVNVKAFKRKKDIEKESDFHDPVRESFEAELERVQRIQEEERQRVLEEQERVMEVARREKEERERLVREEEERRRMLEEEAREASWRAEKERMEALRRTEEQKIAKEEEKRRLQMEEERRKEAARQKLMELEARIAKRQSETNQKDDKIPSVLSNKRDASQVATDVGEWEDGERLVEHITSTTSSGSSMNRYFDAGSSRSPSTRDVGSAFMERGKRINYWKRDAYDNGESWSFHSQDQGSDHHSLRRDTFSSSRGFPRKDSYGSFGAAPMKPSSKGGGGFEHSPALDDFRYLRGNRWNANSEGDHFTRNLEVDAVDFLDNDRYGDSGWASGHPSVNSNPPHAAEMLFQNSEFDGGIPSYGRSRYFLRQPRVLPPPSIDSLRQSQSTFRSTSQDRPISSTFLDNQSRYPQHGGSSEEEIMQSGYGGGYHQRVQQPRTPEVLESDIISSDQQEKDNSPRCDSQSSVSVSNPPSTPTQLSHDELDEAEDSQTLKTSVDVENTNTIVNATTISHGEDDEWAIVNNGETQDQDEYDDEDDGYEEEEEAVRDVDDGGTLEFHHDFDGSTSDVPNATGEMGQPVLGFDEGVEVSIPVDDDLEKNPEKHEKGVHKDSVDNTFEELISVSSKIVSETEKALQELVLDPVASSSTSPSDDAESTTVHGVPDQHLRTSCLSLPMASSTSTVQPISSTVSMVGSQNEAPTRLQFGLFSGPSLIPSPVPAIQIGSIQMPLHLHPQVGNSITQMYPTQPPYFQFGQLQYPSPISKGILPLAPQTVSLIHPPASSQYPSSQSFGSQQNSQTCQASSSQSSQKDKLPSSPVEEQAIQITKPHNMPEENTNFDHVDESRKPENCGNAALGQINTSLNKIRQFSGYQNNCHAVRNVASRKSYRPVINNRESHMYLGEVPSELSMGEKARVAATAPVILSSKRGKRFAYTVRNAGTRSPFSMPANSQTGSSMFQRKPRKNILRTEFRACENVDKRPREGMDISTVQDGKTNFGGGVSGSSARYGIRKHAASSKSTIAPIESENMISGSSSLGIVSSDGKMVEKLSEKDIPSKKHASPVENSQALGDGSKWNIISEEIVDAPIQCGVVRVFKQTGIEAPSDDDDFIEVRSKRQMLNDRREQREKEIKAKSKFTKAPRKHRAFPQNNAVRTNPSKAVSPLGGNTLHPVHSDPTIARGKGFVKVEASAVFSSNMTSQALPPIGTLPVKVDSDTRSKDLKSSQSSTTSVLTSAAAKFVPGISFDSNSIGLVNASLSLGSWNNSDINQQVMALTQSQLDDAMKPLQYESQVSSTISVEPVVSTSIIAEENPFPSSASPLNSLLAGEKIQFGAVTSPTVLPPVSLAESNVIGPQGSSRSDIFKEKLNSATIDNNILFDQDKHPDESCAHLEDPEAEAEAEAAASAVAVAAISNNDEIVGKRLGVSSITDNTELKASGGGGTTSNQEVAGQSVAEESLTVGLPADLSVDTHSLRLWHPLPSPQSTSGTTLSHFSASSHSHFPMGFDMSPIFGGPIFAFGRHDDSGATQAQPQRSTTFGSGGAIGAWPQCHNGVDSFYGPPVGFTGPYISPGVQGPPHMVVYNHFAPVGQFGQVGLSFMGTTYIPTGKQPEWKHNPASSSTVGVSEGEISNPNVISGQCHTTSLPSPIQHLAPGSPLMPLASPLPMFEMSPFQSSADIPYQARWPHVSTPSIHSVPLTTPMQPQSRPPPPPPLQQKEGGMPSQFNGSLLAKSSTIDDQFNGLRSSASCDSINRNISVLNQNADDTGAHICRHPQIPSSSSNDNKGPNNSKNSSRGESAKDGQNAATALFRTRVSHQIGCGDQRGPASQRRAAYHQNRGQSSGLEKGFGTAKMKQIYVAKTPASRPPTTS